MSAFLMRPLEPLSQLEGCRGQDSALSRWTFREKPHVKAPLPPCLLIFSEMPLGRGCGCVLLQDPVSHQVSGQSSSTPGGSYHHLPRCIFQQGCPQAVTSADFPPSFVSWIKGRSLAHGVCLTLGLHLGRQRQTRKGGRVEEWA